MASKPSSLTLSSWNQFWEESREKLVVDQQRHTKRLLLDTTSTSSSQNQVQHSQLTVVHIPLNELRHRRFELPGRSVSFGILISDTAPAPADAGSTARLPAALQILAEELLVCNKRWQGQLWIIYKETDDGWKHFQRENLVRESDSTDAPQPGPRLWQPDPLIETVLLPHLQHYYEAKKRNTDTPLSIWDLGAGVGRDACFLAEHLETVQVTAVDQRYRVPNNNETTAFWQRRGVATKCSCLCMDIQQNVKQVVAQMAENQVDCVFMVRYYNRELLAELAASGKVPIVAVSQFGKPSIGASWEFSTPKEKYVLERDELRSIFSSAALAWEIHHDGVAYEQDKGRTLIQFLASKIDLDLKG